jgi:hypothetical protein
MLDAERQMVDGLYRTRSNSKFIRDLSSVGHGSRVPPLATVHLVGCLNPQCQSLIRYGVQVLLLCQFEDGVCLELAGLIDLRAPGIIHHRSSCTYSVRDLCRH